MKSFISTIVIGLIAYLPGLAFASGCGGPEYELEDTQVIAVLDNPTLHVSNFMIERNLDASRDVANISLYTEAYQNPTATAYYWHHLKSEPGVSLSITALDLNNAVKAGQMTVELITQHYVDAACGYPDRKIENVRAVIHASSSDIVLKTDYLLSAQ